MILMKKHIGILITAVLLAVSGCGSSSDTEDLQKQVDELLKENQSLKEQLAIKEGAVPSEEAENTSEEPDIASQPSEYAYTYETIRWNVFTDSIGEHEYRLIVEINNTSDKPLLLYTSHSSVDVEDSNGHLIATKDVYGCCPNVLGAGEKGYLFGNGFLQDDGSTALEEMQAVVHPKLEEAAGNPNLFESSDVSMTKYYSDMNVVGRIRNVSDEEASPLVVGIVYDAEGRPLAMNDNYENKAASGEMESVSISVDMQGTDINIADAASCQLLASAVVYEYDDKEVKGKEITSD